MRPFCAQLFLALFFAGVASPQEQPRTFRVPFHVVKGLILLDAKVNGQPVTLLLDSGANNSIVDFRTAALADTKLDKLRSTGNVGAAREWNRMSHYIQAEAFIVKEH